jgi:hypothetical protein
MYHTNYDLVSLSNEDIINIIINVMKKDYQIFTKNKEMYLYVEELFKNRQVNQYEILQASKHRRAFCYKTFVPEKYYNELNDTLVLYNYDFQRKHLM